MRIVLFAAWLLVIGNAVASENSRRMVQGSTDLRNFMQVSKLVEFNEKIFEISNPYLYRSINPGDRVTIEYSPRPAAARRIYQERLQREYRVLIAQAEEMEEMARVSGNRGSARLLMQANHFRVRANDVALKLERLRTNQLLVPHLVFTTEVIVTTPRALETEINLLSDYGRPYIIQRFRVLPAKAVQLIKTARNGMVPIAGVLALGLLSARASAETRIGSRRQRELEDLTN